MPILTLLAVKKSRFSGRAEAFDMQTKYLELILGFIGLSDIRSVIIELTLAGGADVAKQKQAEAIEKAKKIAQKF